MVKYLQIPILLVVLMIMGSFPGIYAINMVQHDRMNIDENNNVTDGARTLYVAKNGTDRNDGLTSETPKRNIENALVSANPGDIIRVGPGTYQINLQITKNITLIGDTQNTVIDGRRMSNCITITGANVIIENFIIKNGTNNQPCSGGGIHNEGTLTLENSTITNCTSDYGGGIENYGIMTLKRVTIENNIATSRSGGIDNQIGLLTVEDSTIKNNTAQLYGGGGIGASGTVTLNRVTVEKNRANDVGGGIASGGLLTVEDSTIINNTARISGGGIFNGNLMYVYGSTISNNRANDGGGIYNNNHAWCRAYIDDFAVITGNTPNNFAGNPFIPA